MTLESGILSVRGINICKQFLVTLGIFLFPIVIRGVTVIKVIRTQYTFKAVKRVKPIVLEV